MSSREVEFPEKDLPLKVDVGLLGALVGEVLQEQCGEEFFALVEAVRKAAIARREASFGYPPGERRYIAAVVFIDMFF